jgi:hypothetical protein
VTTIVMEIYEALKAAGIDDEVAKAAAKAVIGVQEKEHLATKLDIQQLRTDMADLKVELYQMERRHLDRDDGYLCSYCQAVLSINKPVDRH